MKVLSEQQVLKPKTAKVQIIDLTPKDQACWDRLFLRINASLLNRSKHTEIRAGRFPLTHFYSRLYLTHLCCTHTRTRCAVCV